MVTKMADKIGLKQRNCHFGPNLRLLRPILKELDISTAKCQKILLICCVAWSFSSCVKISFWYLFVLYVNFSVKRLRIRSKMVNFLFSACFDGHFVTIATVKVKVI